MSVWIVQCLCPARHCILAAAHEAETPARTEQWLRTLITDALRVGTLNPWCGICGVRVTSWTYEAERTPYATMAEAIPPLEAQEAAQAATAAALKAQGRAYDVPRRRQN